MTILTVILALIAGPDRPAVTPTAADLTAAERQIVREIQAIIRGR